jgi:hypothetical protein
MIAKYVDISAPGTVYLFSSEYFQMFTLFQCHDSWQTAGKIGDSFYLRILFIIRHV